MWKVMLKDACQGVDSVEIVPPFGHKPETRRVRNYLGS